jgi:hypothetical protein
MRRASAEKMPKFSPGARRGRGDALLEWRLLRVGIGSRLNPYGKCRLTAQDWAYVGSVRDVEGYYDLDAFFSYGIAGAI